MTQCTANLEVDQVEHVEFGCGTYMQSHLILHLRSMTQLAIFRNAMQFLFALRAWHSVNCLHYVDRLNMQNPHVQQACMHQVFCDIDHLCAEHHTEVYCMDVGL